MLLSTFKDQKAKDGYQRHRAILGGHIKSVTTAYSRSDSTRVDVDCSRHKADDP
jgi:hypothetical protein